jgi:RimJ/RimL family protein N-acetyltransferase
MEITTPRLLLREIERGDLEAMHALYGDPRARLYEGQPLSLSYLQAELEHILAQADQQPRSRHQLAITHPPGLALRGIISLSLNNAAIQEWEIGWSIQRQYWGLGYATEAARGVLARAFGELEARRVVAFCHTGNLASVRVMEKLGMRQEGRLRQVRWLDGRWNDEFLYAILQHEFVKSRP